MIVCQRFCKGKQIFIVSFYTLIDLIKENFDRVDFLVQFALKFCKPIVPRRMFIQAGYHGKRMSAGFQKSPFSSDANFFQRF